MTAVTTILPPGPWTVDDLDGLVGDPQHRYELIDGTVLVAPEASIQHQRVNAQLWQLLQQAAPDDLEVFIPVNVRFSRVRQVIPDLTVVRRSEVSGAYVDVLPLLVVEILSPSNGRYDLSVKRALYEQAGVPSYWIVEPDGGEITVLELVDGAYVETARGTTVTVQRPFPVTVSC